jgi:hypothetical protein
MQWQAFVQKGNLAQAGPTLEEVTHVIADFVMPLAGAIANGDSLQMQWPPGGPWKFRKNS